MTSDPADAHRSEKFASKPKHRRTRSNECAYDQQFVGTTRFELATPAPPVRCATKLRHVPLFSCLELWSGPTERCNPQVPRSMTRGTISRDSADQIMPRTS